MKRIIKITAVILILAVMATLMAGCEADEKKPGPEVGKWHAEVKIKDLGSSMSDEDKAILAMLAGNIMFEVDVEFAENGTFSYFMNTDKLESAVSNSFTTILGFMLNFDISLFVDRIVEAVLQDMIKTSNYAFSGEYATSESELITATDSSGFNIYFKVYGGSLVQVNDNGDKILTFTKAE